MTALEHLGSGSSIVHSTSGRRIRLPPPHRLCVDESGDQQLHEGACHSARAEGHPSGSVRPSTAAARPFQGRPSRP